jgi:hypothetical protein
MQAVPEGLQVFVPQYVFAPPYHRAMMTDFALYPNHFCRPDEWVRFITSSRLVLGSESKTERTFCSPSCLGGHVG